MILLTIVLFLSFNHSAGMQLIIPNTDNSQQEETSSSPKRMLTMALRTSKNALSRMLLSASPRRYTDNDTETNAAEEENSIFETENKEDLNKRKERFAVLFEPKEKTKARIEQIVMQYRNFEPPWTYNEMVFYIHCIKNAENCKRQYFIHWPANNGLDDLDEDCSSMQLHHQNQDPEHQKELRKFLNLE